MALGDNQASSGFMVSANCSGPHLVILELKDGQGAVDFEGLREGGGSLVADAVVGEDKLGQGGVALEGLGDGRGTLVAQTLPFELEDGDGRRLRRASEKPEHGLDRLEAPLGRRVHFNVLIVGEVGHFDYI